MYIFTYIHTCLLLIARTPAFVVDIQRSNQIDWKQQDFDENSTLKKNPRHARTKFTSTSISFKNGEKKTFFCMFFKFQPLEDSDTGSTCVTFSVCGVNQSTLKTVFKSYVSSGARRTNGRGRGGRGGGRVWSGERRGLKVETCVLTIFSIFFLIRVVKKTEIF